MLWLGIILGMVVGAGGIYFYLGPAKSRKKAGLDREPVAGASGLRPVNDQESRHAYLAQAVINSLLRFSLENITLEGFLKCALSVIFSTPPFSVTAKGAIYLIEDDPDVLVMKAQNKMSLNAQKDQRFLLSEHLGGKAISSGRVKFVENVKGQGSGDKPCAYYYVPMLYSGNILGVLEVFLEKGHKRIKREEEFLIAAANAIAGVVQRKRFEERLRNTQYSLVQSEKLSALGRFSSGIAHEVKNPLGIILGGVEFLDKKLASADKGVRLALDKIKESTFRADNIVRNLLKFAMPSEKSTERVKTQDLIKDTLSLIAYRASLVNVAITTEMPEEDIYIEVDRNQIEQVLFNLIVNAVEAMHKGGDIKIKVQREIREETGDGENECIIEIADTGEGIASENIPKVFEPFFTTKRDKKGTGLGLSISRMIIENHDGILTIVSQPGAGTTAKVILPLVE